MKALVAPWLVRYQPQWLHVDLVAGLTAAAIVIPKAMACAVIAGLPVQAGLYTALAATAVYPLLGTSRVLSVSTTSSIAMLTAAQIVAVSTARTGVDPTAVAATLAVMVGGVLFAARLLKLGFLANYMSKPVLVGFEAGVGVVILISQLKSVLGVHLTSRTTIGALLELPASLPHAHGPTMLLAAVGVLVLLGLPRLIPRLPAPLIWVTVSVAASAALGLSALGVGTVGAVPAGLPALNPPDLSLVSSLWPGALAVALMSFTESVAAGRTFRQPDDPPIVADRELVALGLANLGAGLLGGVPAGGGASQTAVAAQAGARSQLAQWLCAAAALVVILFLSRPIGLLPQAALGSVILVAAFSMIKPRTFREIAAVRRTEFMWAMATSVGVIFLGTLEGVLVAVAISVLTLIYQANHPPVYVVAYDPRKSVFRPLGESEADETYPGLLMLRTEGRLTFANANNAADKMQALIAEASPRVIVLECSAIPDIEYTALMMLTEAERTYRGRGVTLWLAAVNPGLRKMLERTELGRTLGDERMFPNLQKALEAWRRSNDGRSPAAG